MICKELRVILAVVLALTSAGCSGGGSGQEEAPVYEATPVETPETPAAPATASAQPVVTDAATGSVQVAFRFSNQDGYSSNQFAIWVEDSDNNYVDTIFATHFTADGGWKERPYSLPLWVERSALAGMDKARIDAVSGATPHSGNTVYEWDCTDADGNRVPAGTYTVYMEATLRQENWVLYSAALDIGENAQEIAPSPEYHGESEKERVMVGDVVVSYSPGE